MINKLGAGVGETVSVIWPLASLGAVLDELAETHVHLDVVQKGKILQHHDNRVGGVWVDHGTGDATIDLDTSALRAGDYALMSQVQRPDGRLQRKIVRYLTLY